MPTMVAEKIDSKTRQVAILLTSVDTQTARQLLAQFPNEQAKRIRSAMTQLGAVSPEERKAALEQFHRMSQASGGGPSKAEASPAESLLQSAASSMDAVEISDQARNYERSSGTPKPAVYANPASTVVDTSAIPSPWAHLTAHELSEILMAERPIVIAVVLNQVPMQLAASLLQLLPEDLAIASLGMLPQVQGTPPDILQEIQEQLEVKLESHRLPLRATQEGIQRLRSILDIADQRFRAQCMQHICREEPTLARRLGWETMSPVAVPNPASVAQPIHGLKPIAASAPVAEGPTLLVAKQEVAKASPVEESKEESEPKPVVQQESKPSIRMSFEEVTLLPTSDLVQVLHSATPEVVLLALSGASDPFYRRVRQLLSAKDAKRLDARMSQIGTIQLRDVDRAQQQLAQIASQLLASGKIGSLVSLTITAVA